jgi:hypothetical protein
MLTSYTRSLIILVLAQAVFGGIALAQAPQQQTPCSTTSGGMTQKEVKSFRGSERNPINVFLCDGSEVVGNISETKVDSFILRTVGNQYVQINYANVKKITFASHFPSRSPGETAALVGLAILFAPLLMLLGVISGWDGC